METEVNAYLSKLGDDRAHSESTQQAYANDLRVFLRYLDRIEDHTPGLHDLNTEQVANFLSAEGAAGHRRSTLIRRLATLRYFQEYLVENGTLDGIRFSAGDRIIQQVISEVPEIKAINCLTEEQVQELNWLAAATFRVTGCLDVARVDFRMDASDGNKPYILEINPLPGLNPEYSDLAIEARAGGWRYEDLVNRILDEAIERQEVTRGAPASLLP
jgi:hypothetical protein